MELCSRVAIFISFVLFAGGIALICAALGTQQWLYAYPMRIEKNQETDTTTQTVWKKDTGSMVVSGLFIGFRRLDWGLGPRMDQFTIYDELSRDVSFMSRPMWICTIVFAGLAILWAVIGIIFSMVNTVMRPVEEISGPRGLYLWSGLALLCTLLSLVLFIVQFFTTIRSSVLLEFQEQAGFTTENLVRLGFSFWLDVGAAGCFALVFLCMLLSSCKMRCARRKSFDKGINGGDLMY